MKIGIYLDRAEPSEMDCARFCIASIRKAMPDADIWHLTTPDGPTLPVDHCLRLPAEGPFYARRTWLHAQMTGDVLFLDVDVIVKADVSRVFDQAFDVAPTLDMKPGAPGIVFNSGVCFSRSPAFWLALHERCKGMDFGRVPGDWEAIEAEFSRFVTSGEFSILPLPGQTFNHVPSFEDDPCEGAEIVHYRGGRKRWMLGGEPITGFQSRLNTPMSTMTAQAEANLRRDLPMFLEQPAHGIRAVLVGGGPSLADTLPKLRWFHDRGNVIFALNGTHDWLIERGIVPSYHVLLDARPENADFVRKPHRHVRYLVAAQCHPDVFDALKGHMVITWVSCMETPEQDAALAAKFPNKPVMMVGGGATVGLKALNIAFLAGFRKLHLFGYDSSYRGDANHAYPQPLNDHENRIEVTAMGRKFSCAPWMAKQAGEFQRQMRQLIAEGCQFHVHGDGLIPWIAAQWANVPSESKEAVNA